MQRVVAALLLPLTGLAGISAFSAAPASAATWNVPCGAAWLVAAVETANDNPGPDTLDLAAGCTYTFVSRYGSSAYALPPLHDGITITGHGAVIESDESAPSMGVASVPGDLLMSDVTLRDFNGSSIAAYFFVTGSLVLVHGLVTDVPPLNQNGPAIEVGTAGSAAIISSTIENQSVANDPEGAAISNRGTLAITGSSFRDNRAMDSGTFLGSAGVISNRGTAEIFDSTFEGNIAGTVGGAIWNTGDLKIHRTSFVDNWSAIAGGAIYSSGNATLLVGDSYFERNAVDHAGGGALKNETGTSTTIRGSSFYKNSAFSGGAIANASDTRIEYSTFSENSAKGPGDSVASTAGTLTLQGDVLSGLSDPCSGTITDAGSNLAYPALGTCPTTFGSGDPKLTAPALHGGSTKTMSFGPGSSAVDAGGNGCPATDQRGVARPVGAACDVGAFEDRQPTDPGGLHLAAGLNPSRSGDLTLDWSDAADPDGDPVLYDVYRADADDVAETRIGTRLTASQLTASLLPEGTHRFRVVATDGNLTATNPATLTGFVVDTTGPSIPTASPDRAADHVAGDGTEWWRDAVTVSFAGSVDPVLADTSPGSGVTSNGAAQTFSTSGEHTATAHAADRATNTSADATLTVHVDADAPTVAFDACPATATLQSTTDLPWTASDAESGLASPASGSTHVDTSTIGEKTYTVTSTDNVGHLSTATCTLHVIYDFAGFFTPVANPPASNTVSAGAAVQLVFSLHGDQGLGIIAAGYPVSAPITCGTNPALTTGQATSAIKPGLGYSPGGTGRYAYPWKTSNAWAGTCRQLVLKLDDGTYHRANFRFR